MSTTTSELPTTLPLHKAWWAAATALSRKQTQVCGCWPPGGPRNPFAFEVCEECRPEMRVLRAAEQALRDANEWELS